MRSIRVRLYVQTFLALLTAAFGVTPAAAACTDPPQVSVNIVREELRAIAQISHNNVGTIQEFWRGGAMNATPHHPAYANYEINLDVYCMTEAAEFKVVATKGGADCEPYTFTTTVGPFDATPKLNITSEPGSTATFTAVHFYYPNSVSSTIRGTFMPAAGPANVFLNEWSGGVTGSRSFPATEAGVVLFEGISCTGAVGKAVLPVNPTKCKNSDESCEGACSPCVGQPINTISGNMTYSEIDPLPGFDLFPFQRTYDSYAKHRGSFGAGWTSIFSAGITTHAGIDGSTWVNLITERNDQYVFHGPVNGPFEQIVPVEPGSRTQLVRSATTGQWTHYDADSRFARVFSGDGLPVAYRDLRSARETRVLWTDGKPTRVEDSWGRSALVLTTDPTTGFITNISPEGRPDLAWVYYYWDSQLYRVDSPAGIWRQYEYPEAPFEFRRFPLSVVRDGQGRLLEQHNYSGRNGTTSIQQTDDITAITRNELGRVSDERKSRVTYKTGRVETYYSRLAGGRWRVVEIDGGCSSCRTGSAVNAFDDHGNVVRTQAADGYITASEYDADGENVTRRRTALRPETCDPATAADHCRQSPDLLPFVSLISTNATVVTEYEYGDFLWTDRPTVVRTASVLHATELTVETLTYDGVTGQVLTRSIAGWTGQPLRQETRTTSITLYDGVAAADFNPGGTFAEAWLTLPQPGGMQRTADGPRTDVADVTSYVYYPVHTSVPALLRGRLAAMRNPAGHVSLFEDYDLHGNPQRTVSPNGVVQTSVFDAMGRLTSSTLAGVPGCDTAADPVCATAITSSRTYNGAGPLLSETQPGGGVTTYEYDDRARVAAVNRGPAAADLRERIETTYDPLTGKRGIEKRFRRVSGTWVETTRESFHYDLFGRVDEVTHADNTKTGYGYDAAARISSLRDENHATPNTLYAYDPAGRLNEVTSTLAATPGGVVTRYAYDGQGNLTQVTDPNGNVTAYVYDDFGQMLRQTSLVTGVTTYEYDTGGNLLASTSADGAVTTRTYDILGRVLTAVTGRGAATESVSWTYDAGPFAKGHLSSMTDPTGSTEYRYDRRGLLIEERKTVGGALYTTGFAYDADGNRTRIRYPSNRLVTYVYDFAGRQVSAAVDGTMLVSSASYLPFGPATEIVYGNGTKRAVTYDNRYRPRINDLQKTGGTSIARYEYNYDPSGNVLGIEDELDPARNRSFTYDDLNRLRTANTGAALWGTATYDYDALGNLLSKAEGARSSSFAYESSLPKLTAVTEDGATRAVQYDVAGNEIAVGPAGFTYSPRNHLKSAAGLSYSYDGRGIRTVTSYPLYFVASLEVGRNVLYPRQATTGTVTLGAPAPAGGVTVTLATSSPGLVVPSSIAIGAGSTTGLFSVTQTNTAAAGVVTITATYGVSQTAEVELRTSPGLASLVVDPTSVTGGASTTGTVTLLGPAPAGGATIDLEANDTAAEVPASLTIAEGQSAATFAVATTPVAAQHDVLVAAEYTTVASATLAVLPPVLAAVDVTPATPMSLYAFEVTVTLTGPAPAAGATVTLASSNPAVLNLPATLTVAAGSTSATVTAVAGAVTVPTTVAVTAALGGTLTTSVIVQPCAPPFAAAPSFPPGDQVWIDDDAPAGAVTIPANPWDATQKASGSTSWKLLKSGESYMGFTGLTQPLSWGENVVFYMLASECMPPTKILAQFITSDGVQHTAAWGQASPTEVLMGPMPAPGAWTRMTIAGSALGLEAKTITSAHFYAYNGVVWFDRLGEAGAGCDAAVAPAPELDTGDRVWIDDSTPAGATTYPANPWNSVQKASGSASWKLPKSSESFMWFTGITQPLSWGEDIVFYMLTNECVPPSKVLAQFITSDGGQHTAAWGQATPTQVLMGPMPSAGTWTRMAIEGSALGLEGKVITAAYFYAYNGEVWFDRLGDFGTGCDPAVAPAPALDSDDVVWIDDTAPTAIHPANPLDPAQKASGSTSWKLLTSGESWMSFASLALPVSTSEKVVFYMLTNECVPPSKVLAQFVTSDGVQHTAAWGQASWNQAYVGPMPSAGTWTRMTIDGSTLGLEGKTITAIYFYAYNGEVWFDRVGAEPAGNSLRASEPADLTLSDHLRALFSRRAYTRVSLGVTSRYVDTATSPTSAARISLYTPELQLLAETEVSSSETPSIAYEYVWFGGQPLAQITTATGAIDWYFNDHLGTPIVQTDATATVVWRAEYTPYGEVHECRAGAEKHQPLRLPGQEASGKNGEYYNVLRWYRSEWGRYTQADPLAVDAFTSERERARVATEFYAYAKANPSRFTDPLGLKGCDGGCADDCPGGQWAYIDTNLNAGLLFGKSLGGTTFVCLSAKKTCTFSYTCTTVGLQAFAGYSMTWGTVTGCKCATDLPKVGFLNIGSIAVNNTCAGGGFQMSKGAGASTVVGSVCTVKKPLACN
jgi:RHS repeat-associated protein